MSDRDLETLKALVGSVVSKPVQFTVLRSMAKDSYEVRLAVMWTTLVEAPASVPEGASAKDALEGFVGVLRAECDRLTKVGDLIEVMSREDWRKLEEE
jgi:hypothetical protein